MPFGLKRKHIKSIKEALKTHVEIHRAVIFGSRAKKTHHPGSDIDIALFGEHLTHKVLLGLKKDLNELNLPYTFDPVIYSEISESALKEHIDRVGITFLEQKQQTS